MADQFSGFDELTDMLRGYLEKCDEDNILGVLETGADELVQDLRKLAKPYSSIAKAGYTHIIDTFSYKRDRGQVVVGWGKYYGRMLEKGTNKMRAQPHMLPTFERNKEKYYNTMVENFHK